MQVSLLHAGDELPATVLGQLHVHRWVDAVKRAKNVGHPRLEKLRRSADPQDSSGAASEHDASRYQCLCFCHDTTTAGDEVPALGRQLESPTDTVEEPDA